jgi:ATPase subunit of ABC transporter with duplicated ATPase domains
MSTQRFLIGIVGPCGAGKTTLMTGLKKHGYDARAIAQEHSYVPAMWQKLTKPDLLIFLQASHTTGALRRNLNWTHAEWELQQHRLAHAYQHAHLIVNTDSLLISEVLSTVLVFLASHPGSGQPPTNQ